MRDKRTTKRKKRKTNPLFVLAMGTALILAGSWSYQLFKMDQAMENRKSQLIEQKNVFITENDKLRKDIEKLNTPSYIEQLARQKLGLVRKGEILIAPKESEVSP
jgi:cell division protein DivIC